MQRPHPPAQAPFNPLPTPHFPFFRLILCYLRHLTMLDGALPPPHPPQLNHPCTPSPRQCLFYWLFLSVLKVPVMHVWCRARPPSPSPPQPPGPPYWLLVFSQDTHAPFIGLSYLDLTYLMMHAWCRHNSIGHNSRVHAHAHVPHPHGLLALGE